MKNKIFNLLIITSMVIFSCKGNKQENANANQTKQEDSTVMTNTNLAFNPSDLPEEPVFDIETTAGTIRIKLYKETPQHRDNFVKLASERFYDGILFHRVIKGFMIQTGDPLTKDTSAVARYGTGGPGYNVPAEILPQFKHKKGALAAARRGGPGNPQKESSGSQFYIVEDAGTCAQLDGDYTVYGETIDGFNVIDKIAATPTDQRDKPNTDIKIISVKPVLK
ncbi:MAG: peptidylprolyl isomerase [Bacteroidales bacterium]|jgi:cyclophilin family peptidyl-prolyl cis-trans isomerase|nr:cypB [Bacteroidota bacterium]MCE5321371.1 peptidylprolyl isomerase [Bacteroidales bacterium]MDD4491492.1 peptidylprolyl isomerase [Bacteroidales bacterium]HNW48378.1 peptidylprolyl isomerase [Bacteroidales bacterium]HPS96084.1 peptidylprolyl isomerase [Bacteroidales bacterium]